MWECEVGSVVVLGDWFVLIEEEGMCVCVCAHVHGCLYIGGWEMCVCVCAHVPSWLLMEGWQ